MAGELKIRIELDAIKSGIHVSKKFYDSITITGDVLEKTVQSIGTSTEDITIPDDIGNSSGIDSYMFIRNTDPTNFVEIGGRMGFVTFDAESVALTAGLKVTGGTSGATGWVISYRANSGVGTVGLADVIGTFENNDTMTDTGSGSITLDSGLTDQTQFLIKLLAGEACLMRVTSDGIGGKANSSAVVIEKIILEL